MRDFARSENPAVQIQLDRLACLSVPEGRLGLEVIGALLDRLGNPQLHLPPVFHVAGTNGKGSVCAFLRAMLEADGKRVHSTISPHLVRYNERIRLAGSLITDDHLAKVLAEVLDASAGLNPSFFEVTIAAAFAEFARVPADACVVEVGLGGRFDATNILPRPAACGIAALGIDHEHFLLTPEKGAPDHPLARIAFEKAGIAKPETALATLSYPEKAACEIEKTASAAEARLVMLGRDWSFSTSSNAKEAGLYYSDTYGDLTLPLPNLHGAHQVENAALAIAMLHHQNRICISREAIATGLQRARWPARLHRLAFGPLAGTQEIWLDGGHNPSAGLALAQHFSGQKLHLIIGMLTTKNPGALISPLSDSIASITVVPVPGHEWHSAQAFGLDASHARNVPEALKMLPDDGLPILIAGSLYLAGEVLRLNDEIPD